MSRRCSVSGKRRICTNHVSHSKRRTRKITGANVHTKRLVNPATGEMVKVKLSTQALRTLQKWDAMGKKYDLRTFTA